VEGELGEAVEGEVEEEVEEEVATGLRETSLSLS